MEMTLNGRKLVDILTDPENLNVSLNKIMHASGWKASTQRLYHNKLTVFKEIDELFHSDRPYIMEKGHDFILTERGKRRYIQALSPKDMLIQHTLTNFILIPILSKFFIHDNGASIKGKGISFTRRRFVQHMHQFYNKHGLDGYILKLDFRKYFDNIRHDKVIEMLRLYIRDDKILSIISDNLNHYSIDVSYSDNDDIINEVFNSLEYHNISKSLLTGKRYMHKSIGIGSPVSQVLGIFFPLRLDNYCKTVKGLKYYDAYMDDRMVIHHSKSYLSNLLLEIEDICNDLGIFINPNKTSIFPIHKTFTFLKTQYTMTDTGKIYKGLPSDSIVRERRKLKCLADIVVSNNLDPDLFHNQYKAWRGDRSKIYNAYNQLERMDYLYNELSDYIDTNSYFIKPEYEYKWFDV